MKKLLKFIRSIYHLIDSFVTRINKAKVGAFTAQSTYYILVSFFPFCMFLLTLLQYIPIPDSVFFELIDMLFPSGVREFVIGLINEVFSSASTTILSITILSVLWASSKGIMSMIEGLNSVYSIKESRNYFVVRILSIFFTIIFAISIIMVLAIFVFGHQIASWLGNIFPSFINFAIFVKSVRFIVGVCILIIFFLLIYKFLPNRKTNLLRELPGAIISSVGWVGFSFIFSYYIDNLSNMSATYGSLTTIVLCMLWLYICLYIMFVGAQVNAILYKYTIKGFKEKYYVNKPIFAREEPSNETNSETINEIESSKEQEKSKVSDSCQEIKTIEGTDNSEKNLDTK